MKRSTLRSASIALAAVTTFAATVVVAWSSPDDQPVTLEAASATGSDADAADRGDATDTDPATDIDPTTDTDVTADTDPAGDADGSATTRDDSAIAGRDTTDGAADRHGPEPDAPVDRNGNGTGTGPDRNTEDEGDAATGAFSVAFDERTLSVIGPDGVANSFEWELDRARGETITDVAVRPGASARELDAIVTVLRGELPHLYQLTVRNGTDAAFVEVPARLQPQRELEAVITPRFTPDGRSVLWTEPTGAGVSLRSIGWDAGAGTGRTADDNATFTLDLPADIAITGFRLAGDDTAGATATAWTVLFTDGIGATHELPMARQSDGALSIRR